MINMFSLKAGDRLVLQTGISAEVIENMEDGMWVQVRFLTVPDHPEQEGEIELCHAQEIVKIIAPQ